MITNIEELQTRVEDTKNQIEKSKELSSTEKMQKAKELESTISKIRSDLDALRISATPEELAEIKTLEASSEDMTLKFNKEFKEELSTLKWEVVDDVKEEKKKENIEEVKKSNNKEKKEKSWIKTQRDKIPDWGKKALKITGGIVWWVLVWKWIKKLFWRGKEKPKNSEKKEWFWNHGIWKWLKWLGIWVWWFFGIKWLIDHFSNKVDKTDTSVDQINSYEKLTDEQMEKYEGVWKNVNNFYWNIWKKESDMWYEDNNSLWTISENITLKKWEEKKSYAWLVPFCIDKDSDNIWDFLWEGELNWYIFSKNYKELKLELKDWTTDRLEKFLWPFVTKLESFTWFASKVGESMGEKIKDWLNDDTQTAEHEKELSFFFRQYSKVLTYMQDRKIAMEYKLAEDVIKRSWYDWDSRPSDRNDQLEIIWDALWDKDWFEKHIKDQKNYKEFLDSNILWSYSILKKNNISNDKPSEILKQNIIEPIDEETDDILQIDGAWVSIVDHSIQEVDWWLSNTTKNDLVDTCDDLEDDMLDTNGTWLIQTHMDWLAEVLNMDDANKETFLKNTGLDKIANEYSSRISWFKEKIKAGIATKEDLQDLKELSTKYIALKKELALAIHTMGSIRSDNPDLMARLWTTVLKMFRSFWQSVLDIADDGWSVWDWVNIVLIWWVFYLTTRPLKALKIGWKWVLKLWKVTGKVARGGVRMLGGRPALSSIWLNAKIKWLTRLSDKRSLFKYNLFNGGMGNEKNIMKKADKLLDLQSSSFDDLLKQLWVPSDYTEEVRKYRKNKNLRKIFMTQKSATSSKWVDKVLRKKTSYLFNFDQDVLKKIKSIDEIATANPNYSKSVTRLLKNMRTVDDLDKLDLLVTDQRFLNKIENLKPSQLKKVARSIWKTWFNINDIDNIIDDTVEWLSKEAKLLNNKIWKQINELETLSGMNDAWRAKSSKKIAWLKKFQSSLSSVDKSEIKIYNEIFDIEPKYFSKTLDIWEDIRKSTLIKEVDKSKSMKKLLNWIINWDPDLVGDVTRTIGKVDVYSDFVKGIKKAERATELWEDIWKMFLKIVKVIAKIT